MKKIVPFILLILLCSVAGSQTSYAKEKVKNEVIVFSLTPPPTCQNCINKIKNNLRFEKGVKEINVDLTTKSVSLTYSPETTNPENLVKALKKIGYTATPYDPNATQSDNKSIDSCSN